MENKISYTISVYNELTELERLLPLLKSVQKSDDEIVILHTYRESSEQKSDNFVKIQKLSQSYANTYETFHFEDRFAEMKNYLNGLATKDYIINFDADEFASTETIEIWKRVISENDADLYYLPRINTVANHTAEDVKKYNWTVNQNNWIQWPDYQPRIIKNNGNIKWVGNVHESLQGYSKAGALPQDPRFAIIHHKDIEKQRKQNALYENIVRH